MRVQRAVLVASADDQVIDRGGQLGVARLQPVQFWCRRCRRPPRPPVGGGQALGRIGDPLLERGGRSNRLGLRRLQPITHLALDGFQTRPYSWRKVSLAKRSRLTRSNLPVSLASTRFTN